MAEKTQKGVQYIYGKYRARIWDGKIKKIINLGTFESFGEAADAYKKAKVKQIMEL